MADSTRNEAQRQTEIAVSGTDEEEKPHGMPLTLGSGGYGGDPCTGPDAEHRGECSDEEPDEQDKT